MPYPARSILAIDLSPFGQSLALLPSIRSLRASYPKTFLAAAATSGTCELLEASGLVDDTISLGVIKLTDNGPASAFTRLFGLIRRSRRYNFDLVLDFSSRLETQIVSRLVMRARVFTPARLPRAIGMLLSLGGAGGSGAHPSGSDYANVLQQAGVEMKDSKLSIALPVEEDARFEKRLASSGSRGGELIVMLHGSDPAGRGGWPAEAFVEIGTRLANNFNARIVAADEPSDQAFTGAVSALLPPASIKLAEPRALELVAAMARASIVITDGPAVAGIASELSTPVIEIADVISVPAASSTTHRIAQGSSRLRVSTDDVYEIACQMIQESRSASLFQRP